MSLPARNYPESIKTEFEERPLASPGLLITQARIDQKDLGSGEADGDQENEGGQEEEDEQRQQEAENEEV